MLAINLTLSIIACQTSPRIEYIHEVPDVVFPTFPPPDSVTLDDETEIVSMPLWYWLAIANYKIDVDAIEAYLDRLREIQKEKLSELNNEN